MDAGSLAALRQLIAMGGRSLLQYVNESSPFLTNRTHDAFEHVVVIAQEESDAVGKLIRYLQKMHVNPILLGSYPMHYTMMNFVTMDCLIPRLIADHRNQVAEIEKLLAQTTDEEAHGRALAFLEMKRRHLQTLNELTTTPLPAAS